MPSTWSDICKCQWQDVAAPGALEAAPAALRGVVGGGVGGAALADDGHGAGGPKQQAEEQQQQEPTEEGHRQDPA